MAPKPQAERCPPGLEAYWVHVWEHALKILKAQGTWAWEQRPLLDEYVFALRAAQRTRQGFDWLDRVRDFAETDFDFATLRQIAGGLPTQWDRHTKRAAALADQLALTPRGRKAIGGTSEPDDDKNPLDALG